MADNDVTFSLSAVIRQFTTNVASSCFPAGVGAAYFEGDGASMRPTSSACRFTLASSYTGIPKNPGRSA
jgi:hypothetical protein